MQQQHTIGIEANSYLLTAKANLQQHNKLTPSFSATPSPFSSLPSLICSSSSKFYLFCCLKYT